MTPKQRKNNGYSLVNRYTRTEPKLGRFEVLNVLNTDRQFTSTCSAWISRVLYPLNALFIVKQVSGSRSRPFNLATEFYFSVSDFVSRSSKFPIALARKYDLEEVIDISRSTKCSSR